jgi:hypothetical protein
VYRQTGGGRLEEIAKVGGYGSFSETHRGKRLLSPSELKQRHPELAARLKGQLKREAICSAEARWRRNRQVSGIRSGARTVAGVLAVVSIGMGGAGALDVVAKKGDFGKLIAALQEGDLVAASVKADDIYMSLLLDAQSAEAALLWSEGWNRIELEAKRNAAEIEKEIKEDLERCDLER